MVVQRTFFRSKALSKWLSDGTLTKKAYLNVVASSLDFGARLVVGLFINPLLVKGLGDYGYGIWQVLGRVIGFVGPAGGRTTQTLKWTIANRQASTDYEDKRRQVGSAIAVWLLLLPLLASLGGLLAWFAPIWFDAPAEYTTSLRVAGVILVANVILSSLKDVPRSVLRGENLGYRRMGLSTFLVFVGGGLTALALYFDTGLVGVATATLVSTILTGMLFLRVTRTHVAWFGLARPSSRDLRWFFRLSGWFIVWSLLMKLMKASDVVLLGILASAELVTVYSLTRYVPEAFISVTVIVVFGITPGLGGIVGSGDLRKATRVRNEIMSFTWLLGTILGATTILWNQSFVQLWVGAEYYAGPIPTLLIIIMVLQFALIRNDASLIDLTLNLRNKVFMGLLSVVLSLAVSGVLVGYFKMGIVGLCLGFIVGRAVVSLGYPWLIGRFLGVTLYSQLKSIVKPAVVTCVLFGLLSHSGTSFTVDTWIGLASAIVATLAVISLLAFYAGLTGEQRNRILRRGRLVMTTSGKVD